MAGTNTGDGGFEIDGKTHVFDVSDPSDQGVDPVPVDSGDISVDHTPKDISKKTKTTLAQYLKNITKVNQYPIDKDVPASVIDAPITDATNNVPTPLPATPSNDPQFAHPKDVSGVVVDVPADKRMQGLSIVPGVNGPQGLLGRHTEDTLDDPAAKLSDLTKGKKFPKKVDGNELLSSVEKDKLTEPVASYTNAVLRNNRFTAPRGLHRIGNRTYTDKELQQVGVMLSLRGSQEFPAAFNDSVNPVNEGSVAGALIPSPNQIGVLKVPLRLLEARDALEHLADNDDDAPAELTIAPIGGQSWGALNNVEEPWAGTLNLGMIAMALALQVAMILAFEGLGALIGLAGGGGQPPSVARNPNGTYTKGSYLAKPLSDPNNVGFPPDVRALLGIHGTRYPFGDALKVGAKAFFVGAEKAKEGLEASLLDAATSAVTNALSDNSSAGFMIIVARLIIRTGQTVAAHIEKIANAFASNPMSGIKAISGLLDMLKQSKLIAAINIFTTLGDAILSQNDFSKDQTGPTEKGVESALDALASDIPGASVKKSRLKSTKEGNPTGRNELKLAWSSNRAPSLYLLPDSVAVMGLLDSKLGGFQGPLRAQDPDAKNAIEYRTLSEASTEGARISRERVAGIEAALDAEYMPFYFHDLRTNEVVGFHAFLASLSDDYTANWETVEGYGRVDPVKIYKSTNRRIGMSFYVAALDRKDFDDMWLKINKLVTLVYPQYTRGRQLITADKSNSFTQPFSQLIGASPLIRIRLGDLFRSNYSRFALARLFGAADGDFKLDKVLKFEGAENLIQELQPLKLIEKTLSDPSAEFSLTSVGWPTAIDPTGTGVSVGVSGAKKPDQAENMNINGDELVYFKFTVKKRTVGGVAVEPKLMTPEELISSGLVKDVKDATTIVKQLEEKYANDANPTTKVVGGTNGYFVPLGFLKPNEKTITKVWNEVANQGEALEGIEGLNAFLDHENNALVKSFRSVQGKGLAGVIESINFDWYDRVTWEIDPNCRAPKMCKVTVSFAPIHDIAPGIDHMGYNRAPVYPVGDAMKHGLDPDKQT